MKKAKVTKEFFTIVELAAIYRRDVKSITKAIARLKIPVVVAVKDVKVKGQSKPQTRRCKAILAKHKALLDTKGGAILAKPINKATEVALSDFAKSRGTDLSSLAKTLKRRKITLEKRILANGKYGSVITKAEIAKFEKKNPKPIRI